MATTTAYSGGSTVPSFLSALSFGSIAFMACIVVFYFYHARYRNFYQPRTFLTPMHKRPRPLPVRLYSWFSALLREDDVHILDMNGPDAYFFVRYIRLMCTILLPVSVLACIVLMPVSSSTPNAGLSGLNMFTFGNVPKDQQLKHVAHLLVAVTVILYVLFLLHREYANFIRIRQKYLSSPAHSRLARARTVMLTHLPPSLMSSDAIRSLVPTPILRIWLPRSTTGLDELFSHRERECLKLERAEGALLLQATRNVNKNRVPSDPGLADPEKSPYDFATKFVTLEDMPSHRIGPLPLVSRKVNTLQHIPAQIKEQSDRIDAGRATYQAAQRGELWATQLHPLTGAAFVRFERTEDAHAFARNVGAVTKHTRINAAVDVVPEDVIWSNLGLSRAMRALRTGISWLLAIGLIIACAVPAAFAGVTSNVSFLCNEVRLLSWICELPAPVVGIVQGVLPPVVLTILFAILPVLLRPLISLQGSPRRSDIEKALFSRMWFFQVILGFLVVTLGSGLPPSLSHITLATDKLPSELATHLPDAGVLFITYLITSTLAMSGAGVSRIVPLLMAKWRNMRRMNTPREVWRTDWGMGKLDLATAWPTVALMGCICIVYSVVQPVVVGIGAAGFLLLYVTYKYLVLYVVEQPEELETGGLYYPRALGTVFVALYLLEAWLGTLFFLSAPAGNGLSIMGSLGGSVMGVMMILTALCEIWMVRWKFSPATYTFLDTGVHYFKSSSVAWLNPTSPDAASIRGSITSGTTSPAIPPGLQCGITEEMLAGAQYGRTTGLHAEAFDPPSTWKDQRLIWMADDELGLARAEMRRLRMEGVASSCEWARMLDNGKVEVVMGPPDEAWYGGMTTS